MPLKILSDRKVGKRSRKKETLRDGDMKVGEGGKRRGGEREEVLGSSEGGHEKLGERKGREEREGEKMEKKIPGNVREAGDRTFYRLCWLIALLKKESKFALADYVGWSRETTCNSL